MCVRYAYIRVYMVLLVLLQHDIILMFRIAICSN